MTLCVQTDIGGVSDGAPGAPSPAPRVCLGCSTTFTPQYDARQYCSPGCRLRAKRRRERERRPTPALRPAPVACVDCGAEVERLPGSGRPPLRCAPCRSVRAAVHKQRRRAEENAAAAAIVAPGGRWWRRLWARSDTRTTEGTR